MWLYFCYIATCTIISLVVVGWFSSFFISVIKLYSLLTSNGVTNFKIWHLKMLILNYIYNTFRGFVQFIGSSSWISIEMIILVYTSLDLLFSNADYIPEIYGAWRCKFPCVNNSKIAKTQTYKWKLNANGWIEIYHIFQGVCIIKIRATKFRYGRKPFFAKKYFNLIQILIVIICTWHENKGGI